MANFFDSVIQKNNSIDTPNTPSKSTNVFSSVLGGRVGTPTYQYQEPLAEPTSSGGLLKTVSSANNKIFNELGGNAILHPIDTLKGIISSASQGADTTINNLVTSAKKLTGTPNSAPTSQKIGVTLDLLHAAASTVFFPVSETFNIASQLPVIKPAADAAGLIFDKAGKITSFASDKLLNVLPISQQAKDTLREPINKVSSLAGQIVLGGYVYGKITGALEAKGSLSNAEVKTIVDEAHQKADEVNRQLQLPAPNALTQLPAPAETPLLNRGRSLALYESPSVEPKPAEPFLGPEIQKVKIKNDTTLNSGDIISDPYVGKFVVTDKKIRILPTGKETIYTLKDSDGTLHEEAIKDLAGFSKETKGELKPFQGSTGIETDIVSPKKTRISKSKDNIFSQVFEQAKGEKNLVNSTPNTPSEQVVASEKSIPSGEFTQKTSLSDTKPTEITGETRSSKIGKSVEAKAIENSLTKGFENTAQYETISIKEQAQRASDLVNTNIAAARKVIRGETNLPEGLRGTALVTAMEEYIKKNPDANLAYELANSPLISGTSTAAQELRLAAERAPDSATARLQELKKAREMKAEKGTKRTSSDLVKELKKEIEKVNLPREELSWGKFLDSITC